MDEATWRYRVIKCYDQNLSVKCYWPKKFGVKCYRGPPSPPSGMAVGVVFTISYPIKKSLVDHEITRLVQYYNLFDERESGSSQIFVHIWRHEAESDMIQRIWLEPGDPRIK